MSLIPVFPNKILVQKAKFSMKNLKQQGFKESLVAGAGLALGGSNSSQFHSAESNSVTSLVLVSNLSTQGGWLSQARCHFQLSLDFKSLH